MFLKTLILCLTLPLSAYAKLGVPTVDLPLHNAGAVSMVAVWSGTSITLSAGTSITLSFPSDWTVPAGLSVAGCACIFLKHTLTSTAGAFTPFEVTITAGSVSGTNLILTLPSDVAPGPFYIRVDDYAALANPVTAGMATLALTAGSDIVESRPIAIITGNESSPGEVAGLVTDGGKAVKGAMVIVSTDTSFINAAPNLALGPSAGTITAKAVAVDRFITSTGVDGRYSLKVPYSGTTTYYVAALYGTSAAGNAVNYKTNNTTTVPISSTITATVNLTTFTICANN